eukprot:9491308-Pyramimonas_sp.AAC.1
MDGGGGGTPEAHVVAKCKRALKALRSIYDCKRAGGCPARPPMLGDVRVSCDIAEAISLSTWRRRWHVTGCENSEPPSHHRDGE